VHITSLKIFGGKLLVARAIIFGLFIISLVSLGVIFNEHILGNLFVLCSTLLAYVTPMCTIGCIKKIRIIYFSLLFFASMGLLGSVSRWIVDIFMPNNIVRLIIAILLQCALLAVCIMFSKDLVFRKATQYIDLIVLKTKVLLLISVWFSFAFAFFISQFAASSPRTLQLTLIEIFAAAIIMSVGIIWPCFLLSSSLNMSYRFEMARLNEQLQAQILHYKDFLQTNENIRIFKHDFDNMITGLIGHANNKDSQAVIQQACEFRQRTQSVSTEFKTGNFGTDALVSDKQLNANKQNAQIVFNGRIPAEYISTLDLCLILGNALDNSIAACTDLTGEKNISVTSRMHNGFLFISVANPVKEDVTISNNMIATTKESKENHGIGLVSVSRTVKKYNGVMKLSCEDKVFSMELELDLNPYL
jgi:sensor histidine kinase YesM